MTRRRMIRLALGLALGATVAGVLAPGGVRRLWRVRWKKNPVITVVSRPNDPRLPLVRAGVDHWNDVFMQIGSPFRFGPVNEIVGAVPEHDLQTLSSQRVRPFSWHTLPASLDRVPGDLIVVLSDAQFISFAVGDGRRVLVGIKNHRLPPLTLPNVLRNVIVHELGHALGLGHNSDPTLLMCGRPASCRPDSFTSDVDRFFPLSQAESSELLGLYPRDWSAGPPP